MKVAVLGAGAWGTGLARVAADAGQEVRMWAYEPEVAEGINSEHENHVYLPGIGLNESISATPELAEALDGAEMVVCVVPSHFVRKVMTDAAGHVPKDAILVTASKGIEDDTLLPMTDVICEAAGPQFGRRLCALSGPSFAKEVASKVPTAVAVACHDIRVAERVQHALSTDYFRIYSQTDVTGVELGGAVKNPVAIAVGISDGMGLGLNTRAALVTRGLAEIARLGVRMGANPMTFAGLAGMGDLVLTCTGDLSRNRTVGLRIGRGEKLADILDGQKAVAEGVKNSVTIYKLAQKMEVAMPIIEQVYLVLHAEKAPKMALYDLMTRRLKSEIGL